jgi:hypothetical protein
LQRARTILFERGGLLAVAVAALYLWVAPRAVVGGDNAEFVTLGTIGGVAHPSGYPLYLMWLRLWSWLPVGSPAHAAAIATALIGIGAVVALHAACRAWGAGAISATAAVAVYAGGALVLQIHTEAEVFALNSLVVATVLWLAGDGGPLRGMARVVALAAVAGLGLANHSTCVLLAPVGLYGAVRGLREASQRPAVVIAAAIAALITGLLPYLYLLLTWEPPLGWTKLHGLGDLVHHFLRLDYGSSGKLTAQDTPVDYPAQFWLLGRSLAKAWLFLPGAVAIAALGYFAVRRGWAWRMLAVSFLLTGPLLITKFNLDPIGTGAFVCERFHLLPILLLAVPLAVALDPVADRVKLPLGSVVGVFVFLAVAGRSLPHQARAESPALENALRAELAKLPPHAVVIVNVESFHFGLAYLQDVVGLRPDVQVISWPMSRSPEYRERVARRTGLVFQAPTGGVLSVAIAEQVFARGEPLYIDAFGGGIAKALPTYPYGIFFRVLPRGAKLPTPKDVFDENQELLASWDLAYPHPNESDQPAADVHILVSRAWSMIADALAASGDASDAAAAREVALGISP